MTQWIGTLVSLQLILICPARPLSLACLCTDLAPIMHCTDEGAFGLCQLLVVAAPEAEGMLVGAGGAVKPACRVLAGVGEALLGRGAQQFEEGQLNYMYRVPIPVIVGELDNTDT